MKQAISWVYIRQTLFCCLHALTAFYLDFSSFFFLFGDFCFHSLLEVYNPPPLVHQQTPGQQSVMPRKAQKTFSVTHIQWRLNKQNLQNCDFFFFFLANGNNTERSEFQWALVLADSKQIKLNIHSSSQNQILKNLPRLFASLLCIR